jgi:Condensation domain.
VPLSPLQEGLWYLDSLDPGNPAYVLYIAVRLSGRVDLAALRGAVAAVVARHEALRTAVVARAGVPEQVVLDHVDCDVTVDDLTDRPADTREQAAVALVQAEVETGFDLDRAPLMRVRLIRLDEAEHVLALCLHHIVADERSLGIVLGEILTGYQRIQAGGPPHPRRRHSSRTTSSGSAPPSAAGPTSCAGSGPPDSPTPRSWSYPPTAPARRCRPSPARPPRSPSPPS